MIIRPTSDRVVIRPDPIEDKMVGSLHIAAAQQDKQNKGTIISVGPGRYTDAGALIPMFTAVTNKVLYSKYVGNPYNVDGEELIIVREVDVICVIDE